MTTHHLQSGDGNVLPFNVAQITPHSVASRSKVRDIAKVLVGGRVASLDRTKSFPNRFLGTGDHLSNINKPHAQIVLETVVSNLEAGVRLLQKQELSLAKMGGRLTDMALALNNSLESRCTSPDAQLNFCAARDKFRSLSKETFDHTALFSNGPARPITIALPHKDTWVGLSLDRCNLATPGLISLDCGKVCPDASGLMLDRESVHRAFNEWSGLCSTNRMQLLLVMEKCQLFLRKLKYFIGGLRWIAPPFPSDSDSGPLSRPHFDN